MEGKKASMNGEKRSDTSADRQARTEAGTHRTARRPGIEARSAIKVGGSDGYGFTSCIIK